jgi:hypothetical protein
VQLARAVRVLERLARVQVLAAVDDGVERDPVGVVRELDARGEEAIQRLLMSEDPYANELLL